MSFQVVDAVLGSNLERGVRFLAVVLATYADTAGGSVFPGVAELCRKLGVQERIVRAGLKRLRELGVLEVESRMVLGRSGTPQPAGGAGRSTKYRFNLEVLASLPPAQRPRKPCTTMQASRRAESLQRATANPAVNDETLHSRARNGALERTRSVRSTTEIRQEQDLRAGARRNHLRASTVVPDVWRQVLVRLEEKLRRHDFLTWFRGTGLVADEGAAILISVPNEEVRYWVSKHFALALEQSAAEIGRAGARFEFLVDSSAPAAHAAGHRRRQG